MSEVRAEYCNAPGSRHPNGNYYTWIRSPRKQKYAFFSGILLKPKEPKKTLADYMEKESKVRLDELTLGNRNDILFRFGCQLRNDGLEEEEFFAYLQLRNNQLGNLALEEEEVTRIAKSVMRYKAGDRTMGTADADSCDDDADTKEAGDTAAPPWFTAEKLIEKRGVQLYP